MNIDEALEYAQNALERAFEDWLETERPSGDCESVHRQWDNSYARLELVDELQPVMALTWEVRRLRDENERIHAATPQQSPGPDCQTCANRGRVNGLSQETYCDGCVWYGAYWKKNHYSPIQEPAP